MIENIETTENKRHCGRKNAATFVFQGATGGAIGVFFCLTFMVLRHPQPYNLIPFLLFLPFVIFLGGVIGAVKGIAYCLSVRFFRLNPQVLVRVGAAVGFTASLGLLWANIAGVTDWRMLIDLSAPGLFIGVPTGLLVGSRIRPWRTIVFGAEEQRRPEFAHDDKGTVPTSRFSVLAGLPLRL